MRGINKKNFNTVVWDGSDSRVLRNIIGVIGMIGFPKGGNLTYRLLDEDHPTTYVIEGEMKEKDYVTIQNVLDERFPGLCAYGVAI